MKECNRCLLNEDVPGVLLNEKGVCSVCNEFDRDWGDWEEVKDTRLKQLNQMFDDCKRKSRPYDVLVPLSGGKDSTYALYQCAKRFGLKCLAVTWDNGFLSDHVRDNIQKSVDKLGVDHIFYRVNWPLLKKLYKYFFLKTGMFCPVCMRGIGVATNAAAEAFDIPLVVNGTCRRTEEHISPEFFVSGNVPFFSEVIKGDTLEKEAREFLFNGSKKRIRGYHLFWWTKIKRVHSYAIIELPDYVDWDYETIYNTISNELNWTAENPNDEHGDCLVSPAIEEMRMKKFPALKPELLRYSKLATADLMTKEEAENAVRDVKPNQKISTVLDILFKKIEITPEQWQEALNNPLKHTRYIKDHHGLLFKTLRKIKRTIIPSK